MGFQPEISGKQKDRIKTLYRLAVWSIRKSLFVTAHHGLVLRLGTSPSRALILF